MGLSNFDHSNRRYFWSQEIKSNLQYRRPSLLATLNLTLFTRKHNSDYYDESITKKIALWLFLIRMPEFLNITWICNLNDIVVKVFTAYNGVYLYTPSQTYSSATLVFVWSFVWQFCSNKSDGRQMLNDVLKNKNKSKMTFCLWNLDKSILPTFFQKL